VENHLVGIFHVLFPRYFYRAPVAVEENW